MGSNVYCGIKISGIAGAVPTKVINNKDYYERIGKEVVDKVIAVTGVEQHYKTTRPQTAGDLGYLAAEELLNRKNIDRSEIGIIIDVTETPDYIAPATAFILHKRLKLSPSCIAFDVNHGCSGYVYGIHIAVALLSTMNYRYALVINGDAVKSFDLTERKNPDHSDLMMFGEGTTATLLEKVEGNSKIITDLYSDGTNYQILHMLGATRCPDISNEVTTWSDGIDRSMMDHYMDGMEVFAFATRKVPMCIKDFLKSNHESMDDYSSIYFHQANKMIIERIAKILRLDMEKVPISLKKYGNTSSASIPITIIDHLADDNSKEARKVLLCGFGMGLSWGCVSAEISPVDVFPMIQSDEYYAEGEFQPI